MRASRNLHLAGLALVCMTAAPASAVVLPAQITLDLQIGLFAPLTLSGMSAVTLNGSGAAGPLHAIDFAGGEVAGSIVVPITDPGSYPITGYRLDSGIGAGHIEETAGGVLRGVAGMLGDVKVCLFGPVVEGASNCVAPLANLTVPLGAVGAGGAAVATGAAAVTVIGAPWTTATAAVGSLTRMGFAQGPASAPSSAARAGGVVQLVTPVFVTTNIAASSVVPVFATLTLHFVPEPASAVLLGGGVALLAAAGRRARRR